jgi:hypothetical protein
MRTLEVLPVSLLFLAFTLLRVADAPAFHNAGGGCRKCFSNCEYVSIVTSPNQPPMRYMCLQRDKCRESLDLSHLRHLSFIDEHYFIPFSQFPGQVEGANLDNGLESKETFEEIRALS